MQRQWPPKTSYFPCFALFCFTYFYLFLLIVFFRPSVFPLFDCVDFVAPKTPELNRMQGVGGFNCHTQEWWNVPSKQQMQHHLSFITCTINAANAYHFEQTWKTMVNKYCLVKNGISGSWIVIISNRKGSNSMTYDRKNHQPNQPTRVWTLPHSLSGSTIANISNSKQQKKLAGKFGTRKLP